MPIPAGAAAGATAATESLQPALRAFLSGKPVFTGDTAEGADDWLGGRQRSALWHPVLRNSEPVGVLAASWSWKVDRMSAREAASVSIFASEAAGIVERAYLLRQLRPMVRTDPVTELPNRRAWDLEVPRAMARAARAGQPLSVAVIYLDHFKAYNG